MHIFAPRLDGDFVCIADVDHALVWNWRENTHGVVMTETGLSDVSH